MDIENALLTFLSQQRGLITDNRPLRLRLDHSTGVMHDVLLPQRIYGTESICGGIDYRVLCVSLDARLPLKELIALPAAIDIVTDTGDLRTICGIVTEARAGDSDGGLATYQLHIEDAFAVMEKRTNTRVFRNLNEVEIVCTLIDEWRKTNPVLSSCFEYELDVMLKVQEYPRREFTMQYRESDAAFIWRLLKRRGIAWCFYPSGRECPAHKLFLFNSTNCLPENAAGTVRFHRDAATEEYDTITAWSAVRKLSPSQTILHSWDYRNTPSAGYMTVKAYSTLDLAETSEQLTSTLHDYQIQTPHLAGSHEDLCQLGQIAMRRHDLESKCFHGEGSVRSFRPGEYFALTGHPEIDGHVVSEREFVLTSLQLVAQNNLPKEVSDRIERLFARNCWDDVQGAASRINGDATRTYIRFSAVRRTVPIVPAFDRSEIPHAMLQSAVVVGPEGEEVHSDELGRVKIRFPGARQADHEHAGGAGASGTDADSAWIRVATNWSGAGFGTLMLPRVGSEVLIDFLDGDPDKPIIVGQVYNNPALPPALERGELPAGRFAAGMKSREIGGSRSNQLSLDDTPGQINVHLASDHAESQLNLGYMPGRPRAARGEGAELRSSAVSTVRGGRGVLITAGTCRAPDALEREGLASAHGTAISVFSFLGEIGAHACNDPDYSADVKRLKSDIDEWNASGGKPVLALHGEAGAILGSNGSVSLAAEGGLDAAAKGNVSMSSGESLFVRAARSMSLLAYKFGMKLVAVSGDIQIQSQDGCIEISAKKRIKLVAHDSIELHAPSIRTVAEGAMADYGGGKIVQQCRDTCHVRSAKFEHTGGGDGKPERISFTHAEKEQDQQVRICDNKTGEPLPNCRYRISADDGRSFEGTTDDQGFSQRFRTKDPFSKYRVEVLHQDLA
ncbi:type VI secretion system Vgr family protein [Massilia endophytica]|uniref:type VI secretion system Vgr family protein n=1 Tax=Massilia endophytica TaxID=2899220 RepID=UPI001E593043|nr:type VI secretion system Vgr family protein [Massilia endophytica]UGQ48198.1 type VI secretion system tip protein VgrG [Massilia endophytica]